MADIAPWRSPPSRDESELALRVGLLVTFSALLGGLLWILLEPHVMTPVDSLVFLLGSFMMAALAVRIGGGLGSSLLVGYSFGVLAVVYVWIYEEYGLRGLMSDYTVEYVLLLGWLFWYVAPALVAASAGGFLAGTLWTYRGDLHAYHGWIISRVVLAVIFVVLVWLVWEYGIGRHPVGPTPYPPDT